MLDIFKDIARFSALRIKEAVAPTNRAVENLTSIYEENYRAVWPEDFRKNANAYRNWAYVCTKKIGNAVASARFHLYVAKSQKAKINFPSKSLHYSQVKGLQNRAGKIGAITNGAIDVEEITNHPFLDMMKNVNPFMNAHDLWALTETHLGLMGNAYWYVYKDALGVPREIWPIPPQYMWIVPSRTQFISGYIFQKYSSSIGGLAQIPFSPDEIIHFKYPDPENLYYGTSPLGAVADAYNKGIAIDKYTSAAFANMARPDGVLEADATISSDVFERVKRQFAQRYSGTNNAARTMILEGGLKWKDTSFKPIDMGSQNERRDVLERVAAAYGVPLQKLIMEGSNRASSETAQEDFLRDTIKPELSMLEEKINEKLLPMYGDGLFVAFDDPVPANMEFRLKERETNIRSGYATRNEERARDGLLPLPAGGDELPPFGGGGFPAAFAGQQAPEAQAAKNAKEIPEEELEYLVKKVKELL